MALEEERRRANNRGVFMAMLAPAVIVALAPFLLLRFICYIPLRLMIPMAIFVVIFGIYYIIYHNKKYEL